MVTSVQKRRRRLAFYEPAWLTSAMEGRRLLAILLNSGGAQPGQTVLVDRELPGQELVHGQGIATARLFERQEATANGGDNLSLAADDPPLGTGRWQIRNGERT